MDTICNKEKIIARSEGISYQQLLDSEVNPVPEALRTNTNPSIDGDMLDTARYLSREYHERELATVWKRTWQMVCRESEVTNAGDFHVYDIARYSIIVVRGEDGTLRGFHNACLHRGRTLKSGSGCTRELRCPYHGFVWNLDGSFKTAACLWDFPHIDVNDFPLPQVKVDTWGGWVFINMDQDAMPLKQYLGVLPQHFERWQPEQTYKAVHVAKVIPCNWKLAWEAFAEAYHSVTTHPQILPWTGDCNSQYDIFNDYVSRTITPHATISPHLSGYSEQDIVDRMVGATRMTADGEKLRLPESMAAREYIAQLNYAGFSELAGTDLAAFATRSEVMDSIYYSIFPNFAPWAGFHPNLAYRFRPNGDDHASCIMDIMLLMRYPPGSPRPSDVPVHWLGVDEPFSSAPELGALGAVYDQDFGNLPQVQKGLHNLQSRQVVLAKYQEVRLRHFHRTLERFLSEDSARTDA